MKQHRNDSHRWCQRISGLLIRARRERGWSQAALGERLGLSQSLVATMERDPDTITVTRLLAVLKALDLELIVQARFGESNERHGSG